MSKMGIFYTADRVDLTHLLVHLLLK